MGLHRRRDGGRSSWHLEDGALALALGAILVVTLRPFDADNDLELVPFADLVRGIVHTDPASVREALVGTVGNVLLFMPFGVALALRGSSLARVAAVAFVVSASIELAQLFVPGRTTAVDDLVCNVAGAVLGYALAAGHIRLSEASGARSRRPHAERVEDTARESDDVAGVPIANRVAYGHKTVGDERYAEGCQRQS